MYLQINLSINLSIQLPPDHAFILLCLQTFCMGGHTLSEQHERAATWLKLTSVARRSASGAQHTATSHSPTLPGYYVCMCISLCLGLSVCFCAIVHACACRSAYTHAGMCVYMGGYFCVCLHVVVVLLCLEHDVKQERWARLANTREENQYGHGALGHKGTWRYRSGVRGCVCVCVWPGSGFTWCLTYKTDTRKTAATVRERQEQKKNREMVRARRGSGELRRKPHKQKENWQEKSKDRKYKVEEKQAEVDK